MDPRTVGLTMIGIGLVSLLAVLQLKQGRKMFPQAPRSVAGMLALLIAVAAGVAGMAVTVTPAALAADKPAGERELKNPYGGRPGGGISLPPYFRPTPSITGARANYFPLTEILGPDEMRVSFVGSNPWIAPLLLTAVVKG